jgi:acyl-CoA dehydrogenase
VRGVPDAYWRELDAKREYPEEFVRAMSEKRYLAALIPEEYGGLGMDLAQASVILEEINRSGGNAQPAHAQVYTMGTLLRHGSEEQKKEYLPKIASGELRLAGLRRNGARGRHRHHPANDDLPCVMATTTS